MRKVPLVILSLALTLLGCTVGVVTTLGPSARPTTDLKVRRDAETVARGRYLAEHVLECMGCHTRTDHTRYGGAPIGPLGAGGDCYQEAYSPGRSIICVPNITSDPVHGVGAWTDDKLLRAFREGVGRTGEALYPEMRYSAFRHLSDDDAHAVVAYLRTLPPVAVAVPDSDFSFWLGLGNKTQPVPLTEPVPHPDTTDPEAMGAYLVQIAGCIDCHTPFSDGHARDTVGLFSGGDDFPTPQGPVRGANITTHPTGTLPPTEAAFIARFRAHAGQGPPITQTRAQTVMPWRELSGLTDADLRATYAFIRAQPPVDRQVNRFPPAGDLSSFHFDVWGPLVPSAEELAAAKHTPRCDQIAQWKEQNGHWPRLWTPCRPD